MLGRGQIQKMLQEMVAAGCQYAVVETSSEGILQYRHIGLNYDVAVFTNLGTEHSERHGGVENLRRDKGKLFRELSRSKRKVIGGKAVPKVAVVNLDDAAAAYYLSFPADKKYGFTFNSQLKSVNSVDQTIIGRIKQTDNNGSDFFANDYEYRLPIVGDFNVANALAALAVADAFQIDQKTAARGLNSVTVVPGRMEFIEAGQSFRVVVDFAHEPMSYEALFRTLRSLVGPSHKVIGVIGSDGGGRDIKKRGIMGKIAGKLCDIVVVSDVNCYDDDPKEIAEMLAQGAREAGKKDTVDLFVIVDRRRGIRHAFALAGVGDVVAITAKGTEPYIAVADGKRIPWDDRAVARELLKELTERR